MSCPTSSELLFCSFTPWYDDFCLNHLQRYVVVWNGKRLINSRDVVLGQLPAYTSTILSSTLQAAVLRNREDAAMASQKIECNLSWSAAMSLSDLRQYSPPSTLWRRKIAVSKRCVPHYSYSVLSAVRQ